MEHERQAAILPSPVSVVSHPVISDDMRLVRKQGIFMEWVGEDTLRLWSTRLRTDTQLNASAAFVWLLSDGRLNVKGIKDYLVERYSEQAEEVIADVPDLMTELLVREFLEFHHDNSPVRPLLKVGYCNFWLGFDPRDNYFLRMLTHKFDVMLTHPVNEPPDLLFYSLFPSQNDHKAIDRSQTVKVLVNTKENYLPDPTECDYMITTDSQAETIDARQYHLPVWSLYVDWESYEESESAFRESPLPKHYKPENVCEHLFQTIFECLSHSKDDTKHAQVPPDRAQAIVPPLLLQTGTSPVTSVPIEKRKLTIGMATYDDFDGVYFTVQAIRLYHPEVTDDITILVVDNNPSGPSGKALRDLGNWVENYQYIPYQERQSTAVRDMIFYEASSDYVLCVDSHVLIVPGVLKKLLDYLDEHPDCQDLLQGPLVYDDLRNIASHFTPEWSHGMYGVWGLDERGKDPGHEPFDIPMQGLGLFACRRDAWPGFNPRFLGFGGEEGYIHEKFRQAGGRTLCLPFLRWVHRFGRPADVRYQNIWEHRIRNYMIGFTELGLDTSPMEEHFRQFLGQETFERIHHAVMTELDNPFFYFDAIYCINLDSAGNRWQAMRYRFKKLGILNRVRRFSAIETTESHHIGCTLSHRQIIELAQKQGLKNVLVFEDDAIFLQNTLDYVKQSVEDLKRQPWNVFHLGGFRRKTHLPKTPGCQYLQSPGVYLSSSHGVAYNQSIYHRILKEIPADVPSMKDWMETHEAIDKYLRGIENRYLAFPVVASQPCLLPYEDSEYRDKFTL